MTRIPRVYVNISRDLNNVLKAACYGGQSIEGLLREQYGLPPLVRGRASNPNKIDKRQKYPVLGMSPGETIIVPWNRDENGHARVTGINSAVARCNRIPGRRYTSRGTGQGLEIIRLE